MASFIAAIVLGKFSDKVGKLSVFTYSVIFSLIIVLVLTDLPVLPFSIIILLFIIWFIVATGRAVTAQAMISNVVKPEQRGSYLSFNSSVQQLGTALASLAAGFIVIQDSHGKLQRYEWVGYLSVFILLLGLLIGRYLFSGMEKRVVKEHF
jgi:MFS family permease